MKRIVYRIGNFVLDKYITNHNHAPRKNYDRKSPYDREVGTKLSKNSNDLCKLISIKAMMLIDLSYIFVHAFVLQP